MKPHGGSKGDSLRKRAEKILSQKPQDLRKIPAEDMRRLIHELDVHQIELDMQNEELRRQQVESDEARNRYRDLYDFAPVGYFTFDPDGRIAEVNLTGARLLGLPRSRVIGRSFSQFVEKDSLALFRVHLQEVLAGNIHQTCELKIKEKPERSSFYVSLDSIAAGKDEGIKCRSAVIDITERKQAQEVLRRYELLSGHSRDIILFMRRDDGRILEANAAAMNTYGYSRDELLTLKIQDLRASDTHGLTADQMAEANARGILFETVHRRKDGSTFPVEVSSRGETTGATRTLMSVIRDITERKRAEQVIHLSEKRYRSYIEVTEQLGWTTNAGGEVLEDIPSWRKFTGQSEEEVKGWGWSKALHAEDLEHATRVWRNAVATRTNYEVEYRIRRYDGAYRHFLARGVPAFNNDGTVHEWVGTCIDITERNRTEEALKQHALELRQLNETLEQRVQKRTSELANANEALHQLSMKLLSAQEDERKRVAGELHDTIGSCLSAAKFKVENTLQQIGKIPNGASEPLNVIIPLLQEGIDECRRIQMDLRPPMLDDLGLLATLSWFFRRFQTIYSGIQIGQDIGIEEADVPLPLKTVVFRVTQEAMNNIAKYSKADLAHLFLGKKGDRMELLIRDNGQGFNLEKINSPERGRRGLGLTSMRERIELSGGSFSIESTEGEGTIIRASWPLQADG